MRSAAFVCGFAAWLFFVGQTIVWARQDGEIKISQTTPDMVPLVDTLREVNEPESGSAIQQKLNEQVVRELAYLRQTALTQPADDAQRVAASHSAWFLGLLYLHGAGVVTNSAKAKHWFILSAHYGEAMASAGLAWCAYEGCQSSPNWAQSQHWVQQLMSVDLARALYMQWLLERRLRPISPNISEGLASLTLNERGLLEKAVAAGSVHAMVDLGILCAQSHDLRRALILFERAAVQSDIAAQNAAWVRQRMTLERRTSTARAQEKTNLSQADAIFKAGRQYHRGDGVSVDYVEAIRLYRQADSAGSQAARRMLSLIYSRIAPDGGLDPVWMRQLSEMDVSSLVPKQDVALGISSLRREPTPLIDLLPRKWARLID